MINPPPTAQPVCSLTISTHDLAPVSCSAELSRLLGYRDEHACVKSFAETTPFEGLNVVQMLRLASLGETLPEIGVVNRKSQRVGLVNRLLMDDARQRLTVNIRALPGERRSLPSSVSLLLDDQLMIIDIDDGAADIFNESVLGESFVHLIPTPLCQRISAIYRSRLNRHGRIRLSHLTLTRRAGIDFGEWQVSQQARGYTATFHPETDWPVCNLLLNRGGQTLFHTPTLAEDLFKQPALAVPGNWFEWIDPMDRDEIASVIGDPRLPSRHSLHYQLIGNDSVIRVVRHDLIRRGRLLAGRVSEVGRGALSTWHLKTLAIALDLPSKSNELVMLQSRQVFDRLVLALREALQQEGRRPLIRLTSAEPNDCTICGDTRDTGGILSPALVMEDVDLDTDSLRRLATDEFSQFRLGATSPWPELIRRFHDEGLHLSLALDDQRKLMLTVGQTQ